VILFSLPTTDVPFIFGGRRKGALRKIKIFDGLTEKHESGTLGFGHAGYHTER